MTKKEAIEQLNRVVQIVANQNTIDALNMAIKALEQQPCEDEDNVGKSIVTAFQFGTAMGFAEKYDEMDRVIKAVTPKEKTGHWIVDWSATSRLNRDRSLTYEYHVHCDRCGYRWDYTTDKKGSLVSNFCPNCGAKMLESEE